ncbi:MAG: hypothetical protein ABH842_05355 [Candidatus Micrarchaeota archaeon]
MKFRNKKGQAVMEYLITYGLALFVILVVLGILVAVVIPALKPPEECQFTQPGFSCNQKQHVLVSNTADNSVEVLFYLTNDQGAAINITGVMCTTQPSGNINKSAIQTPPGGTFQFASGAGKAFNSTLAVPCYDENGDAVILGANSNFKGSLAVRYTRTDDIAGAPERLAVATLTGTVQSE